MKAPRLHELTARVVAWHNRHPLARRIDATQVHSIGEVRLPFASALPWGSATATEPVAAAAPPAHGPTLAEALAQRNARLQAGTKPPGIDGLDVQSVLPDADPAPVDARPAAAAVVDLALDAPATAPADDPDDDDGEAALVIPLLDGDDAAAEPPATAGDGAAGHTFSQTTDDSATPGQPQPAAAESVTHSAVHAGTTSPAEPPAAVGDTVYPPPHGAVPVSALAQAVERRAAVRGAMAHAVADDSPPAPPAGRWQRLVAALRRQLSGRQAGLPPLRAAFSDAFIWPLRPARVARWAQRHGQPQPLAPADWPRRTIDTDRGRLAQLRQQGLAHDLPLHVLTAAIGVGDRRIRVLVGADGSILGPRAYHRSRVGSLGMLLAIGLVGLGWHLRPLQGMPGDGDAAALAALAASAASAVSAAASASPPMAAASVPDSAASADALALAASAAAPAASLAGALASGAAASDAQPPVALATAPTAEAAAAASQPQASIQPSLSEEERYAARVEAARMRGEPIPAPPVSLLPGPVYAVVGPASRQREAAAGGLAKMKSAASRLDGHVPEHGELVESQGQWRAAWWPFTSLVDAERARVLLAGQGLKAEVIEF